MISDKELREWKIYFKSNPTEKEQSERIEIMLAQLSAVLTQNSKTTDFLLVTDEQREQLHWKEFNEVMANG